MAKMLRVNNLTGSKRTYTGTVGDQWISLRMLNTDLYCTSVMEIPPIFCVRNFVSTFAILAGKHLAERLFC